MDICLDTNAYSALMRGDGWGQVVLERADSLIVPTVALGELYASFAFGRRKTENIQTLQAFLDTPGTRPAEITQQTAERYGKIVRQLQLQGTPIPTNDIWIAAACFETGATLLSSDAHFSVIPIFFTVLKAKGPLSP